MTVQEWATLIVALLPVIGGLTAFVWKLYIRSETNAIAISEMQKRLDKTAEAMRQEIHTMGNNQSSLANELKAFKELIAELNINLVRHSGLVNSMEQLMKREIGDLSERLKAMEGRWQNLFENYDIKKRQ